MFTKKAVTLLTLSCALYVATFDPLFSEQPTENNTLLHKSASEQNAESQQAQNAAWTYIKHGTKVGVWGLLTYWTTAGIIRTFFNQKSNARLSKQQLIALIPVALASGYAYYYLLLKNNKKPQEHVETSPT
jgi:hypothetical protein